MNIYKYSILSQDRLNLNNEVNFLKTHSCCGTINNYKFTNKENTLGFIYIVRDPRSVAISYAHHSNISYDSSTCKRCMTMIFSLVQSPNPRHYFNYT